jgi:hypothetical protein
MIWTFIWLITYIQVSRIELQKENISVNIEHCENLYFTDFELFEKYNCDFKLVTKRIRQAKGIE